MGRKRILLLGMLTIFGIGCGPESEPPSPAGVKLSLVSAAATGDLPAGWEDNLPADVSSYYTPEDPLLPLDSMRRFSWIWSFGWLVKVTGQPDTYQEVDQDEGQFAGGNTVSIVIDLETLWGGDTGEQEAMLVFGVMAYAGPSDPQPKYLGDIVVQADELRQWRTAAGPVHVTIPMLNQVPDHACGNGVTDPGEICDDGNTTGPDTCAADCRMVTLPR